MLELYNESSTGSIVKALKELEHNNFVPCSQEQRVATCYVIQLPICMAFFNSDQQQ